MDRAQRTSQIPPNNFARINATLVILIAFGQICVLMFWPRVAAAQQSISGTQDSAKLDRAKVLQEKLTLPDGTFELRPGNFKEFLELTELRFHLENHSAYDHQVEVIRRFIAVLEQNKGPNAQRANSYAQFAKLSLAKQFSKLGKFNDAISLYESILENDLQESWGVIADLMETHYSRHDVVAAIMAGEKYRRRLTDKFGESHYSIEIVDENLAMAYVAERRYDDAINTATRCIAWIGKHRSSAIKSKARMFWVMSAALLAKRAYREASAYFDDALLVDDPWIRDKGLEHVIGLYEISQGDIEKGKRILAKWAANRSEQLHKPIRDHFDKWIDVAALWVDAQNFSKAIEVYAEIHEQTGDRAEELVRARLLAREAYCFLKAGKRLEAEAVLKAIEKHSRLNELPHGDAFCFHYVSAIVFNEKGNFGKAEAAATACIELINNSYFDICPIVNPPLIQDVYLNSAKIYDSCGEHEKAETLRAKIREMASS